MSIKVTPSTCGAIITRMLDDYLLTVSDDVEESVKAAAEHTAMRLRNTSPERSGAYAKSWSAKRSPKRARSVYNISYVVYNKKHYRLTHLLEKGHAKVNGGRVAAIPHISVAEQEAAEFVKDELLRRLSG